ncbi:MAG: hypothetical protein ABIC40_01310 [bacterium]
MPSDFDKKVSELARELEREIGMLEKELTKKKELFGLLSKTGKTGTRKPIRRMRPIAAAKVARRGHGKPERRKSANREALLYAAREFNGQFKLADLIDRVLKRNPKFGGSHPTGAVLTVIRATPEIKKVKRGFYKLAE